MNEIQSALYDDENSDEEEEEENEDSVENFPCEAHTEDRDVCTCCAK